MTILRICIDLHSGQVKQIVGSSLTDNDSSLLTNFSSLQPAGYYARLYRTHNLTGAHVIKLGKGNDEAALEALAEWPNGLQIGGGISIENAQYWIDNGGEQAYRYELVVPGCCV
jgi:phosphoribosylformimino-5-aminoimidazole carboxamide ribotide isomerase